MPAVTPDIEASTALDSAANSAILATTAMPSDDPSVESGIHVRTTTNGRGLMLEVVGKFSWAQTHSFAEAYDTCHHFDSYMVDMSKCTKVTPSGICALLLLKEFADKNHSHLQLANTNVDMAQTIRHADIDHQLSDVIKIDPSSVRT